MFAALAANDEKIRKRVCDAVFVEYTIMCNFLRRQLFFLFDCEFHFF